MRVGVDLQPVSEVRRSLSAFGDRYRRKLFTEREIADCGGWDADPAVSAASLAARVAAKEATLKALRVQDDVPRWRDIEIVREPGGWPSLHLHERAARLASRAGLVEFEVSLSHADQLAVAVVVAR